MASTFSQYLRIQGINHELEQETGGWAIWVHSEDEVPKARDLLMGFARDPEDARFRVAALTKPAATAAVEAGPETLSVSRPGKAEVNSDRARLGPLTLALMIGCLLVALASEFGDSLEALNPLLMTSIRIEGAYIWWHVGLPELMSGELWRLVTPILIHQGPLHLIFNLVWLYYLGRMVESRAGTSRLLFMVAGMAVVSNLGQYWSGGPNFGGMSGVIYGLLGYVWMKCRFQPAAGYRLSLNTVTFMLIWFFACIAGIIPGIANVAHACGLLAGLVLGVGSAKWAKRTTARA